MAAKTAPAGVRTGGCAVMASGMLANSDHVPTYQGGCAEGYAQGQGKATWHLVYAPAAAPVVWQGRFDQGVFLSEQAVRGARRVDRTNALLDLGDLKGPGHTGRLWTHGRVEGDLPPLACKPYGLHVSAKGTLADDEVARQWLQAAYQRWLAVCGAQAAQELRGRHLRVTVHEGDAWTPDSYGNLPSGVLQAYTDIVADMGAVKWRSYTNQAAQKQAEAAREQQRASDDQASEQRLRELARQVGAAQYVSLTTLDQNPFRFGSAVLLVAVRLREVRSPTEAWVRGVPFFDYGSGAALVQGDVVKWTGESRVIAVRVKGRSKDANTPGVLELELLRSASCTEPSCADYLRQPGGKWREDGAL